MSTWQRYDCSDGEPEQLAAAVAQARAAVTRGECIVLPTDTVYGIGADAFSAAAVQRLLDAKQRGRETPPPVLIGDTALIAALASDVPPLAQQLVERHWPGPLTIVLRRQHSLQMDLGETGGTIALRVPDHPLAREILRATGPLAVSSANLSGQSPALTCDEAIDQLGDAVSVYLDSGRLGEAGQPVSTIVDFSQVPYGQLLRRGSLGLDLLTEIAPDIDDLTDYEADFEPESADPEPNQV